MSQHLANPKLCAGCKKANCELKCACNVVFYCGHECQSADWASHQGECRWWLSMKVKAKKKKHGKDHEAVAMARIEAGEAHELQGRYQDAEQCYMEARRVFEGTRGPLGQGNPASAMIFRALGCVYQRMGQYDKAMSLLQESLLLYRSTEGERSNIVGKILRDISGVLHDQEKDEEALEVLEEAHTILTEAVGTDQPTIAMVLSCKGKCLYSLGRLDEAQAMLEEAVRIDRMAWGGSSVTVAASLANLGLICRDSGKLDEAMAKFEEALEIERRLRGDKHPLVATAFKCIADLLSKRGQHDEALEMLRKGLKITIRTWGKEHSNVAMDLFCIGLIHARQGTHEEAVKVFSRAMEVCTRALGIDNIRNARTNLAIAMSKRESGDLDGALENARESVRIHRKRGSTDREYQNAVDWLKCFERWAPSGRDRRAAHLDSMVLPICLGAVCVWYVCVRALMSMRAR